MAVQMKKLLQIGLLLTALVAGAVSFAQEEGADLGVMLADLEQAAEDLRALTGQIDAVPESAREVLAFRRDDRSFRLLSQLNALVQRAAELPPDDPVRLEVEGRLKEDLAGAGQNILARIAELAQRVEEYRARAESETGVAQIVADANVQGMAALRFRYYRAMVDVVEGRSALGMPVDRIAQSLEEQLYLHAEILVGSLEFTGTALKEIRARLKRDPENADLIAAARDMEISQRLNLDRLDSLVKLLARLNHDVANYRTALLKHTEGVSLAQLDRGAVKSLFEEGWDHSRDYLVDQLPELLFKLLVFVVILALFRGLSRLAQRAVRAACERPGVEMSTLLKDTMLSLTGGAVMGIGILMALSQIGISLGPMLAGLGVAGFIIGFALQDTLGNFAAGGMILIYRPYDVDDFIEVAGASGLVKKMNLVSTTIATFDNQTLVVPNSKIWGDVIKNVTAQKVRRVDLLFGIGYSDDIPHAERVLKDIVANNDKVLEKPEPVVRLHELGESSVNFIVRPWVKTEDYWDVYWSITRAVKVRFDEEGISIPFPQRDVHHYNAQGQGRADA